MSGGNLQYIDTGIATAVVIREGQKVVVGKANMDGSDRASIVVLKAKVVDYMAGYQPAPQAFRAIFRLNSNG